MGSFCATCPELLLKLVPFQHQFLHLKDSDATINVYEPPRAFMTLLFSEGPYLFPEGRNACFFCMLPLCIRRFTDMRM